MSEQPTRRRFIAGATCPRCGRVDKIAVDLDSDRRLCVSCGFSEERPAPPGGTAAPGELPSRANRAIARRVETPAEAVKLVDPTSADDEPA